tara:strand:+ start:364 stop:687 length:324 start_codon:yes stop_codon:yes gene_type:complete
LYANFWNKLSEISTNFYHFKIYNTIQKYVFETCFDLIFYDTFGFRVQPELWQKDVFMKMVKILNRGGVLVTYCAKGEVKRILKSLVMQMESLAGPTGEREMIRSIRF